MAENVGTGVLGLPGFVHTLGFTFGIIFIVLQVPLNLFAGKELCRVASETESSSSSSNSNSSSQPNRQRDFFTLSKSLYDSSSSQTPRFVAITYYTNLVLVMANYFLTMSKSIQAMIGKDRICLTTSGIVAFVQLLIWNQNDKFKDFGRGPAIFSIFAVVSVMVISSVSARFNLEPSVTATATARDSGDASLFEKIAACAGICFAIGSQKLLLNVRQDIEDTAGERASERASCAKRLTKSLLAQIRSPL